MTRRHILKTVFVVILLAGATRTEAQLAPPMMRIKAIGKEGAGNPAAAQAWKELTNQGPEVLTEVLAALDDATPIAANYLRSAVEAIADKALANGKPLPKDKLEAFIRATRHAGAGRRLAYDLLVRIDPTTPGRLLPGMLDDPGAELRRDAVAVLVKDAAARLDKGDKDGALTVYRKALGHARDREQVKLLAKQLKSLGVEADLLKHFGYVTRWMVIGPFDNTDGTGFHKTFPPEKGVDVKAAYRGKDDKEVRWAEQTANKDGEIDFNKLYGEQKGVTAFAYAVVESPAERAMEVRAESNDAIRIYLNGKEIFAREEYHHGTRMDQHIGRGVLKAGRNTILIKVCQNEQSDDWARLWSFRLRVCDAIGGAVPLTQEVKRQK